MNTSNSIIKTIPVALLFCFWIQGLSDEVALPRATPESTGIKSSSVESVVRALDALGGMHSFMLLRKGQVIAEGWWAPYSKDLNHVLYSLSKSFTSTAVGFALAEGKISLDDPVTKFFPKETPAQPSNHLKAMRLRDALSMSTGHQDEPPLSADQMTVASFLNHPVPHLPGTHFKYNTPATFIASAIVQKIADQTVLDYLKPRLFKPLGISNPVWDTNKEGISLGGYGLRVRTEDIAKFGQLYLQKGIWRGKQLLPESWIDAATIKQVSNGSNPASDWNQGYGFQFWRSRHNTYRGDGAFGQYCVVIPEHDAVVAITSGVKDMQAVLNVLWEKLLPAFNSRKLSRDKPAHQSLLQMLGTLAIPTSSGSQHSPLLSPGTSLYFEFNPVQLESDFSRLTLRLDPTDSTLHLTTRTLSGNQTIRAGFGKWVHVDAAFKVGPLAGFPKERIASSYAWKSADTLEIRSCAVETPFHVTQTFKFEDQLLHYDSEANVAFGATKRPRVSGKKAQ